MEVLQQLDTKSITGTQKQTNSLRYSDAGKEASSGAEKPFKDQLNQQMDQAETRENKRKVVSNQLDKQSDKRQSVADIEARDTREGVDAAEVAADSDELKNSIVTQAVAAGPATPPATLLPEDGSDLPLSGVETPLAGVGTVTLTELEKAILAPAVLQVSEQNVNAGTRVGASEVTEKSLGKPVVNASAMLAESGEKTLLSESTTVKPQTVALNLTTGQAEKIKIQDAQYSKIMSDIPSADVIAQTTRMQKVPLVTALSASIAATQNISAGQIQDIAGSPASTLSSSPSVQGSTLSSSIFSAIQNPNWSQQMTQQVAYMIKGGFQQAEIKLNPAHLGPMEIKLSINDDQASVNFVTQHAAVRDALDAALPRLKDMLEQQGLNLSDANVSTQSEQQQASTESHQEGRSDPSLEHAVEAEEERSVEHANVINVESGSGVSIFA